MLTTTEFKAKRAARLQRLRERADAAGAVWGDGPIKLSAHSKSPSVAELREMRGDRKRLQNILDPEYTGKP